MKCNKCKKELKENSNYCNYCGNRIINYKGIISSIMNAVLYIFCAIFLIIALHIMVNQKGIVSGIIMILALICICPFTYRKFVKKHIKMLNNNYIRIITVFLLMICSIVLLPSNGTSNEKIVESITEENIEEKNNTSNDSNTNNNVESKDNATNENKEAIKNVDENSIGNSESINVSIDDSMIKQFTSLGFNIEEATEMQQTFNQMGITTLSDIHSGSTNPDINGLVSFIATANNNAKQKFYFTIENRKMFYAGFTNEDLYDSEKGGVLKNINDVHIPETKVTLEEYSTLQVLAQNEVRKYLNYPNSASFPLYDGWGVGRSDNTYKIYGKVNAVNGYGVKSDISFSVLFIKNDNTFTVDAVLLNGTRVK